MAVDPAIKINMSAILVSLLFTTIAAVDTIIPGQPMKDGQTLISTARVFELGFFSPGSSSSRYLGLWYNKNFPPRQVVWVANRASPIPTSTGVLRLSPAGDLAISDGNNSNIWSTGTTSNGTNPILQLLDNGNLVLNDSNSGVLIWQSFDHPSHMLLPGMKLGRDKRTNLQRTLSSWKSDLDPSPGHFTYTVKSTSELYLADGSTPIWRSGPWDGDAWNGFPVITSNDYFNFHFISNHDEIYFSFDLKNKSIISVVVLEPNGELQRMVWLGSRWNNNYWKLTRDSVCEEYRSCGDYSVCENNGSPSADCKCLQGFQPRSVAEWGLREWSGGCIRRTPLACGKKGDDGFAKVSQLKLPDMSNTSTDSSKGLDECRNWCLQKCSCSAYAVISPEGGGCINWFGELVDIRKFAIGVSIGKDLYLRLSSSDLDDNSMNITHSSDKDSRPNKRAVVIIPITFICGAILISLALCTLWSKRRKEKITKLPRSPTGSRTGEFGRYDISDDVTKDHELPSFSFSIIAASTDHFSHETKIGEGGFGPVHKGTLPNGQEIAVKMLSKGSVQGVEEFRNEIKLIANLQHKNLVRLLGCSIKDDERLLVYEYMPNRSLDNFLFDPARAIYLDWQRRITIIHGVAQGLLYLHKYSRLRIIHRDLKCSNILLDSDMNPKISDFGIARIFGGNQDHANTRRVMGTYGYMPPEYAIKGLFSEKSDVFSFGVLLLEIVSGKKNGDFHQVGALLGHVWELWMDGRVSELMDPVICDLCPLQEITKYVHVGLLCVQEDARERPTMSSVMIFLNSDSVPLPSPRNVALITSREMNVDSSRREDYNTWNEVTITAINPR